MHIYVKEVVIVALDPFLFLFCIYLYFFLLFFQRYNRLLDHYRYKIYIFRKDKLQGQSVTRMTFDTEWYLPVPVSVSWTLSKHSLNPVVIILPQNCAVQLCWGLNVSRTVSNEIMKLLGVQRGADGHHGRGPAGRQHLRPLDAQGPRHRQQAGQGESRGEPNQGHNPGGRPGPSALSHVHSTMVLTFLLSK